ncbi:MAG: hypothetical protein ACFFFK_12705 [Candidatus Thorarchaeota archaeon]
MSENLGQEKKAVWKLLVVLLIAALLSPHTLQIINQSITDASFTRYSVITVLLTAFYEYGHTLVGPYSTLFIMPPTSAALLNALTFVLNILIILSQFWFIKGTISRRNALLVVGIILCIHVALLLGVFSYQLNGTTSVLAIPLPIFPIIVTIAILRAKISKP